MYTTSGASAPLLTIFFSLFGFSPSFVSPLTPHPSVVRVTFKLHAASCKSCPASPQPTLAVACVVVSASNGFFFKRRQTESYITPSPGLLHHFNFTVTDKKL